MMLVLFYFLSASDDFFVRKVVRVIARLSDKLRAVEIALSSKVESGRCFVSVSLISPGVRLALGGLAFCSPSRP